MTTEVYMQLGEKTQPKLEVNDLVVYNGGIENCHGLLGIITYIQYYGGNDIKVYIPEKKITVIGRPEEFTPAPVGSKIEFRVRE